MKGVVAGMDCADAIADRLVTAKAARGAVYGCAITIVRPSLAELIVRLVDSKPQEFASFEE